LLLAAFSLPGFCAAQSSHRVDVFVGYSLLAQDISLTNVFNHTVVSGWNASATFPIRSHLAVVADFSGFYPSHNLGCGPQCDSTAKIHNFLGGPQFSIGSGRLRPFARFLVGDTNMYTNVAGTNSATFTSNNSLAFGAGGGIDFAMSPRLALRTQADWLHNGFQTTNKSRSIEEVRNVARVSLGAVLRF